MAVYNDRDEFRRNKHMADMTNAIERFRKMANDDPKNELGHFSLGKALLEAGQSEDAAASLRRCLELNPNLSKAYQLLGTALLNLKRNRRSCRRANPKPSCRRTSGGK